MASLKLISGRKRSDKIELENLSKEELIEKINRLEAHNLQLRNIIAKTSQTPTKSTRIQKKFDFSKAHFRHVLLKFYYLGWHNNGFAVQEDTSNTIEHHLFQALIRTCLIKDRESSNYHRCGRTDKGVSAFSQVISINLRSNFTRGEQASHIKDEIEYCKLLNKVLPNNIQCVCWSSVPDGFSARFDCSRRTYKYFFPLAELNIEAMKTALTYLIGTHDFRNFCKMDVANGVISFIRNIKSASIEVCTDLSKHTEYSMCRLTLIGRAFLWHQVRCIVGVLLLIGGNKEKPDVIKELLDIEKNPRKPDYNMASEVPLNLFSCDYDETQQWVYDLSSLADVISKLQARWTMNSVKATMMKHMLYELENASTTINESRKIDYTSLSNCLLQGIKPKVYIPLMERQRCDALEDRIDHYVKKRRLILTQDEPTVVEPIESDATIVKPIADEPMENESPKNEPTEKEPTENEPTENKPLKNELAEYESTKIEPIENDPVANESVAVEPIAIEPVTKKPTTIKTTIGELTEDEPMAVEFMANKPTAVNPKADESTANEPMAIEPIIITVNSLAGEPTENEPMAVELMANKLTLANPKVDESVAQAETLAE